MALIASRVSAATLTNIKLTDPFAPVSTRSATLKGNSPEAILNSVDFYSTHRIHVMIKPQGVTLLTQWYQPAQASRLDEMSRVLQQNCDNPFVQRIVLLNEQIYEQLPVQSEKITQVNLGRRLTLGDAFAFAAQQGQTHEAWCLANSDIAFDDSLGQLYFSHPNEVHCLTRYDWINGTWDLFQGAYMNGMFNGYRADSQDSWLFLTPQITLKPDPFTGLSPQQLEIGRVACDNKAALILHVSGLACKNSSKTIKTYHYHFQRDQQFDQSRESSRYPMPYLFIEPVEIHEPSQMRFCMMTNLALPVGTEDLLETLRLDVSFQKRNLAS